MDYTQMNAEGIIKGGESLFPDGMVPKQSIAETLAQDPPKAIVIDSVAGGPSEVAMSPEDIARAEAVAEEIKEAMEQGTAPTDDPGPISPQTQDIHKIAEVVNEMNAQAVEEVSIGQATSGYAEMSPVEEETSEPTSPALKQFREEAKSPKRKMALSEEELIALKMGEVAIPADPQIPLEEERTILEKELRTLVAMPFIELHKYRSTKRESIGNLEDAYRFQQAAPDTFAKMNVLDHTPLKGTPTTQVLDRYHELHRYGGLCMEAVEAVMKKVSGEGNDIPSNSVSFLSYSMAQSCHKRVAEARELMEKPEADKSGLEAYIKRTLNIAYAYEHRECTDTIFRKLQLPFATWEKWQAIHDKPQEALKLIKKVFVPVFQDANMTEFRRILKDVVTTKDSDEARVDTLCFFLTYWLASVYSTEYESGRCGEIKAFITNVYDCWGNTKAAQFDIPGGEDLLKVTIIDIMLLISVIIDNTKSYLKANYKPLWESTVNQLTVAKLAFTHDKPGTTFTGDTSLLSMVEESEDDMVKELTDEIINLHVHQRSMEQDRYDEYLEPSDGEGEIDPDMDAEFNPESAVAPPEPADPELEEAGEGTVAPELQEAAAAIKDSMNTAMKDYTYDFSEGLKREREDAVMAEMEGREPEGEDPKQHLSSAYGESGTPVS